MRLQNNNRPDSTALAAQNMSCPERATPASEKTTTLSKRPTLRNRAAQPLDAEVFANLNNNDHTGEDPILARLNLNAITHAFRARAFGSSDISAMMDAFSHGSSDRGGYKAIAKPDLEGYQSADELGEGFNRYGIVYKDIAGEAAFINYPKLTFFSKPEHLDEFYARASNTFGEPEVWFGPFKRLKTLSGPGVQTSQYNGKMLKVAQGGLRNAIQVGGGPVIYPEVLNRGNRTEFFWRGLPYQTFTSLEDLAKQIAAFDR